MTDRAIEFAYDFLIGRRAAAGEVATEVAGVLEGAGYRVKVQDHDFGHGGTFGHDIHKALIEAHDLVVLYTADYDQSHWMVEELTNFLAAPPASDGRRRVCVLRCDDSVPRGLLAGRVFGDLVGVTDPRQRREIVLATVRGEPLRMRRRPPPVPTTAVERRLVAILAADVVGYSRLVEQDELGTLAALEALRREVIGPLVAEHRGRIVDLIGDGAIVEFGSVVDAVCCAVALQKGIAAAARKVTPERRIVLRIGVNLGDVVVEGDDLMGDGVNVAARLEQLCPPGEVLVSGTAYDHLQGKLGLPLEFAGEHYVKNISRPIRTYRVRLDGRKRRWRPPLRRIPRWPLMAAALSAAVLVGLAAVLRLGQEVRREHLEARSEQAAGREDDRRVLARQGEQIEAIRQALDRPTPELVVDLRHVLSPYIPNLAFIADERLPAVVEAWLRDLQRRPAVPPEAGEALKAVLEAAQARMGQLDLAGAADLLDEAIAVQRRERQRRTAEEAALLAERARVSRLQLRYREAAATLREAAALVGFDRQAAWQHLLAAADALRDQGEEFGDNEALRGATALYADALRLAPRQDRPGDWAATQTNLGNALQILAAREAAAATARLEQAVAAYRAALEERTRERAPVDWAATQSNLGLALQRLGEREAGTARLEQAVAAYREALEGRTRERAPVDWAATQTNLGVALQILGVREAGTARLEQAVAAYREALEERTRERAPVDWAATQNNLGVALLTLGVREAGTARLEEAAGALRAALEVRTRERLPLAWAQTQTNLGLVLQTLGAREAGAARLEQAVAAYREALEERTRERAPVDWAAAQTNLGIALQILGEREAGTGRLEEAVAAYRAALEVRTRERLPLAWAQTQTNLGNALQRLGEREAGTGRLEEAVAAFRAALGLRTRGRAPLIWANTENNLGIALSTLGGREGDTARLEEAVAAYRAALEELTRTRVPLAWARTQNNLGAALQRLGAREAGTARLEEAVAAFRAALEELTRARVPLDWATTQANLGLALLILGAREAGTGRLEEAVAAFRATLEERTRGRAPLAWASSQHGLALALEALARRLKHPARMAEAHACMGAAAEVYRAGGMGHWLPIVERSLARMEAELTAMEAERGWTAAGAPPDRGLQELAQTLGGGAAPAAALPDRATALAAAGGGRAGPVPPAEHPAAATAAPPLPAQAAPQSEPRHGGAAAPPPAIPGLLQELQAPAQELLRGLFGRGR